MGIYNIQAAVPAPYINTLCANVAGHEIAPLVYANQTNVTLNSTLDFSVASTYWYTNLMNWTEFNSIKNTSIDDVFGWTKPSDRPAFYKLPADFNTVSTCQFRSIDHTTYFKPDLKYDTTRVGSRLSVSPGQRRQQ
jgi:hypothetical protein